MAVQTQKDNVIQISEISTERIYVPIIGTTPMLQNQMANKARYELLFPSGRKTTADKRSSIKHYPLEEYRNSLYKTKDGPTLLTVPARCFKKAMVIASLEIPGVTSASIKRLVRVEGENIPLYGVPELHMSVVRMADINKTPDIRTRGIIPLWATMLEITFPVPMLNKTSILNLLAAAGSICGIGEWRPERGSGNFGQYTIAPKDSDDFKQRILKGGRKAQQAAFEEPTCYDEESEELLTWFQKEFELRGKTIEATGEEVKKSRNKKTGKETAL